MQISGKVIGVKETETVTATFKKREIWLETPDDKYPQTIAIEFQQDKCALLDDIAINEDVTIDINIRGRQWKDKVFNTIAGWKITKAMKADESRMVKQGSMSSTGRAHEKVVPSVQAMKDDIDDLPF